MHLDFILVVLLFLTIYFYFFIQYWEKKTGKRLPGPPKIPIFGSLPFVIHLFGKHNYEMCREVAKKYGPVFGVQIGMFYHVVVEDLKIAREILGGEDWKQRNSNHSVFFERSFNKPLGVLMGTDAGGQREIRKYTTKLLRQFGRAKRDDFERSLAQESEFIVETLRKAIDPKTNCGAVNMQHFFHIPSLNILWNIMAGVRFSPEDSKLKRLLGLVHEVSKAAVVGMTPVFAFPFLRYIPNITEHDSLLRTHYKVQELYKEVIDERRANGSYKVQPSNFIEAFMKEIDKRQEEGEGDRTFYTDEQLITVGMDLFMTGSDTTSTALEFAILFMLRFPQVQAKVQEEIDSVIGRDRLPHLADKISMPYTEATTWEIMRCTCLVPIAIRTALRDGMKINGVTLKKETMVGINLVSIHYSKELWEDPQSFRPERFLNEKMELVNLHKIIPFGFGKRACIGDWLAKSTFYTFFVTCMQNFTFEKVPWLPEPSTKTYSGIAQYPMQFSALVKPRY